MAKFKNRFGEFTEGELVRYDVFPHGTNILGMAMEKHIVTIDRDFLETCAEEQMAPFCEWEYAFDVRKEVNDANKL